MVDSPRRPNRVLGLLLGVAVGAVCAGMLCLVVIGAWRVLAPHQLPPSLQAGQASMTTPPTTRSVEDRLIQFGPESRQRWLPLFAAAGVPYPPARLVLAAFKSERLLAVHAAGPTGPLRLVRTCPILGASGVIGPKLREGDRQVPEGVYRIALLNPNSKYQVSLRIDYPNDFDRATAAADGRTDLGGDIMIHGGNTSAGCLAMGDETSADLFILAADTGIDRITVLLCPVDFRHRDLPPDRPPAPPWIHTVYADLRARLRELQP